MDKPTEFRVSPSLYNSKIMVLRIRGFIDVNAAPDFERKLENLMKTGHFRILVDLAEVTYISSAGVGVFVGLLESARSSEGGDIKICRASAKLKKVFEAIGLDCMMDFLTEESEVTAWSKPPKLLEQLENFKISLGENEIFCGREFTLRVEARDAEQNIITDYRGEPSLIVNSGLILPRKLAGFQAGVWEGNTVITDSGILTLILVDEQTESRLNILVKEEPHKAEFPCAITCRCCGRVAQVRGTDIYRCRHCNEIVYVDAWAHLLTLKSGSWARRIKSRYKGMELKINGDVNYLNAVRRFINSLCEQENLDELTTNAVILTTEEALLNIIEHGNKFDPRQMLKVKLSFQKRQLVIQIRDYGDPHDVTQHQSVSIKSCIRKGMKGGVGEVLINKLMDRLTYRSYKNYNLLTLVKRYPPIPRKSRKSGSAAQPAKTSSQSGQ